jgi:hypothetical protein
MPFRWVNPVPWFLETGRLSQKLSFQVRNAVNTLSGVVN